MVSSPYASVRTFVNTLPSWVGNTVDAERISAYKVYEDIYWSSPSTFQLTMRGTPNGPIYIPSGRVIVEATNRFLAKSWDFAVSSRVGTPNDQTAVQLAFTNLFKREMMWTKFATQRRYGLMRGDALWHIVGDPLAAPNRRLSIYELDPSKYFPITDELNTERVIGCHIVDQVTVAKKVVAKRQTYRKTETGTITSELALYELGKWDDRIDPATGEPREVKLVAQLVPPTELPPQITALPVYHVKNNRIPGLPFGASEMCGVETLMSSINQSISDEDLALALQGLGLYWTTSGPPVDSDGNEINWTLGPGEVVEVDTEASFNRVNGITSVTPSLDHIRFVMGSAFQATGVPQIAAGDVDVTIAESGIALFMQLSPLLAKNEEKETEMLGVYDHMLYDILHMWFPAYEGLFDGVEVEVVSVVDDPMPVNREARIAELLQLVAGSVISAEYARQELVKLGYEFPLEMGEAIVAEQAALTSASYPDPYSGRVEKELTEL